MIKVLEGTIHDIQSVRNILEILYPNHESAGWYHTDSEKILYVSRFFRGGLAR